MLNNALLTTLYDQPFKSQSTYRAFVQLLWIPNVVVLHREQHFNRSVPPIVSIFRCLSFGKYNCLALLLSELTIQRTMQDSSFHMKYSLLYIDNKQFQHTSHRVCVQTSTTLVFQFLIKFPQKSQILKAAVQMVKQEMLASYLTVSADWK